MFALPIIIDKNRSKRMISHLLCRRNNLNGKQLHSYIALINFTSKIKSKIPLPIKTVYNGFYIFLLFLFAKKKKNMHIKNNSGLIRHICTRQSLIICRRFLISENSCKNIFFVFALKLVI